METLALIIGLFLVVYPLWLICRRAGFHGALSLVVIIPWFGLLIVGAILSFATWRATSTSSKEQ
jgi:hypothetical protein